MRRPDLVPDCSACAGLCCIATSFERSADFAIDKPFGARCRHLDPGGRCAIHAELAPRGFAGCTIFECYGAGPRVMRAIAASPDAAALRDEAFLVARELHELSWLLTEAMRLCPATEVELHRALGVALSGLDAAAAQPLVELAGLDASSLREAAVALLRRVGAAVGRPGARHALRVVP